MEQRMSNNQNLPSVTILIPCRNEEAFIGACLDSLILNRYPVDRLDILIVDGVSTDNTRTIVGRFAQSYPHIRHNSKITPGHPGPQ